MPRLRYKKDFNYDARIKEEFYSEDPFDEISDSESSSDMDRTDVREIAIDRGWLSTENIISSLSDKKLKYAILYHREILQKFKSELDARASGLKPHIIDDGRRNFNFTVSSLLMDTQKMCGVGQRNRDNRYQNLQHNRKLKSIKNFVRKLKLSPPEQDKLIREWKEILRF